MELFQWRDNRTPYKGWTQHLLRREEKSRQNVEVFVVNSQDDDNNVLNHLTYKVEIKIRSSVSSFLFDHIGKRLCGLWKALPYSILQVKKKTNSLIKKNCAQQQPQRQRKKKKNLKKPPKAIRPLFFSFFLSSSRLPSRRFSDILPTHWKSRRRRNVCRPLPQLTRRKEKEENPTVLWTWKDTYKKATAKMSTGTFDVLPWHLKLFLLSSSSSSNFDN